MGPNMFYCWLLQAQDSSVWQHPGWHNLSLLIVSRVAMGALQSSVFPAMYALINRCLTMGEVNIYTPMLDMSLGIGSVLAGLVPGLVADWSNVFYIVGALCIIWSILWLFISTSDPSDNRWVSEAELAHIMKKKKNREDSTLVEINNNNNKTASISPKTTPWLKIPTCPSVIALIIVKLTDNFCHDFVTVELPSYLKYVHHATMQRVSSYIIVKQYYQHLLT